MKRIEVTGHRGAALLEPENTLRSIRKAIELRCDRVEIDVHHCKSGELVVIHDETVERTTNGTGRVADLTFHEIRRLDAGKGERVPILQEVIDTVRDQIILQIELKGPGTAAAVVEHIRRNAMEREIVVTSFHADRVQEAKTAIPELKVGLLASHLDNSPLEVARQMGASALHLHHSKVSPEIVRQAHEMGLELRVWNIDDEPRIREVVPMSVDGIGSNRPDLLIKVLTELGLWQPKEHRAGRW